MHLRLDHLISKHPASGAVNERGLAVVARGREHTYADLNRRANGLAAYLRSVGVRRGDRVLGFMHNRVEWFDLFFAVAKLRAVLVPANHFLVPDELEHLIQDSGAVAVVTDGELVAGADFLVDHPGLANRLLLVEGQRPGWQSVDVAALPVDPALELDEGAATDEPFLLQYTSGTTGRPKGAVHTQGTVLLNALSQVGDFQLGPRDVMFVVSSFGWVAGFHGFTLATLLSGGTVVVGSGHALDPVELSRTLVERGVTITALPILVMRKLLEIEEFSAERGFQLRMIVTGGEPVPVELMRAIGERVPGCDVVQFYGMTEFPSSGVFLLPGYADTKLGSVGKGGVMTQLRVVDDAMQDLPPGVVGEVVIRSPATALGYWNRPEESAVAFAEGWYRTGDLGRLDEDGFLFISGRSKDMIITGGLNVYPAEVEQVLARHPAVGEAAVVGVPDDRFGEVALAVVVPRAPVTVEELVSFASERLAKYKRPRRWLFQEQPLPRTVSGKLKKFEVRDRLDG
ncbi:class I adenylate-forming enzyme family protein [Georgenia sp. SYP-B2076]|uniref:class I adenylate-forming enzyme family protein n=1 Tax=Georgenia sp. SYP-B2076 TaxID=2495881 RepID=UPI0013E0AB06|nr:AMP-binding protein [Georgenia sp. SYP-B2076]